MVDAAVRDGFFIGFIDAVNSFEPSDWADDHLRRILWMMRSSGPGNQGSGYSGWQFAGSNFRSANVASRAIAPHSGQHMASLSTSARADRHGICRAFPQPLVESVPVRMAIRTNLSLSHAFSACCPLGIPPGAGI